MVQFYDEDEELLVTKAGHFLAEGWKDGAALLVVGSTERNTAIGDQLGLLGINVPSGVNSGRLVFFDADEMVSRLVANGQPEWLRFDALIGAAVRELRRPHNRLRVYGEMVGILWARAQYDAAARLEGYWNRLLHASGISLFCAYPIDVLSKDLNVQAVDTILCAHTHLLPTGPGGELAHSVDRAMEDVLGGRAEGLKRVVDTYFRPSLAAVPKPESMLLWLRTNLPQYADQILDRARRYYRRAA